MIGGLISGRDEGAGVEPVKWWRPRVRRPRGRGALLLAERRGRVLTGRLSEEEFSLKNERGKE